MDEKINQMVQRITELEFAARQGSEDREELKASVDEIKRTQKHTDENVALIKDKITRWEGRFGGVIFIVGCLWAFFSGAASALLEWFKIFPQGK